jgi:hypothetical protein
MVGVDSNADHTFIIDDICNEIIILLRPASPAAASTALFEQRTTWQIPLYRSP